MNILKKYILRKKIVFITKGLNELNLCSRNEVRGLEFTYIKAKSSNLDYGDRFLVKLASNGLTIYAAEGNNKSSERFPDWFFIDEDLDNNSDLSDRYASVINKVYKEVKLIVDAEAEKKREKKLKALIEFDYDI